MGNKKDQFVKQTAYTKRITLDVTPEMHKAIKAHVLELETNIADYLRDLIEGDLNNG